jgi:hypothetical protein
VKSPDKDNWGKLKRVLKYLKGTKYLKLRLSMKIMGLLKWYVNGSHNIHPDCRGHRGALFSMAKGSDHELFKEVETEHLKLDREQAHYSGHVHA